VETAVDIITIENLSHRFADGRFGLQAVDLSITAGSFVVICGSNGSGKTTLMRHLNGLLQPTTGSVTVDGVPVAADLRRARQRVGMVFQDADSQIVGETVYDDVAFGPENLGLARAEIDRRVRQALTDVGLARFADQSPHRLSGGEKRRLAIAGVLAMGPRVIVFDEPFSNLDFPGVKQVLGQIVALHRTGHTVLVTTHDIEKILPHAERLIVIQEGRIRRDGPPQTLLEEVERYGVRAPCAVKWNREITSWLN
jgi:biotin transport system ATP-binding protein